MPAMPIATPNSFRGLAASRCATASVRKNVKIGEVELRMVASPGDQGPRHDTVEASLKHEAAPGRCVCRQPQAAPMHDQQQNQARNRGSTGNQGDRRNCRYPKLDESV